MRDPGGSQDGRRGRKPRSAWEGQSQSHEEVTMPSDDPQGSLFQLPEDTARLRLGDKRLHDLQDARARIASSLPAWDEYKFFQVGLASVHLPTRPTLARTWEVRGGDVILNMSAGRMYNEATDAVEDVGLPYGAKARLILIYLATLVTQRGLQTVDVGRSLGEFIARLNDRDAQDSDYASVRDQLIRLTATEIYLVYRLHGGQEHTYLRFVRGFWSPGQTWGEKVTLSDDFFQALKEGSVPLDGRAVRELRNSPTGLDIYQWLAHRLCHLKRPSPVSWPALKDQFGRQVGTMKKFRERWLDCLTRVLAVYEEARPGVQVTERGVVLTPAPPPVPRVNLLG
jgi:Plasmid encoded RepA protein